MRCKNCGSENEDNLYICQNCGSPLYDEDEPVENKPEDVMGTTRVVPVVQPTETPAPKPPVPPHTPDDEEEEKKKKQQIAIIVTLAVVLVIIVGILIGVIVKNNSDKKPEKETLSVSESVTQSTKPATTEHTTKPTTTTEPTTEPTTASTTETAKYNIEVICPDGGGTVRGGGNFAVNSECKVIATPDPEFEFDGWYENSTRVSRSKEYTFTVVKNQKLVAKFTEVTETTEAQNE